MDEITIERIKSRSVWSAECLLWGGAKSKFGYGNIYVHGRYVNTHRAMWVAAHGAITPGLMVCHHCDTPACVNLKHLFLGSQADNMRDKSEKGRALSGPCSRPEWWTAERRATRAEVTRARMASDRASAALAAGVGPGLKRCPACNAWKTMDGFHRNRARNDGYKPYCKPCSISMDVSRKKRNA